MTTFFAITSIMAALGGLYFRDRSLRAQERADALSMQCAALGKQNHKYRSALSKEQRKKLGRDTQTHLERRKN